MPDEPSGDAATTPERSEYRRRLVDPESWPIVVILALCWAAWAWFLYTGRWMGAWGVSGDALREGRYEVLLLTMFAHGGLLHLLMNSSVALAMGPIAVSVMGGPLRGSLPFVTFYLLAGLAGSLAFVALNWGGTIPAVGASGAISGLIGLVSRLDGPGRLLPLAGQELRERIWQFVKSNLLLIALFALPALLGGGRILIAWEAHLGGFVFGLLAAGLFVEHEARPDPA